MILLEFGLTAGKEPAKIQIYKFSNFGNEYRKSSFSG
jgi:hypothetical protein